MSEETKRGLGWYSRFVYPLLVLIFAAVFTYYELARLDLGNHQISRAEYVSQHHALGQQFFLWGGLLVVIGIIWAIVVSRDKKKHPERYIRYHPNKKTKPATAK